MTWLELAVQDAKARFGQTAMLAGYRADPEKIQEQVARPSHGRQRDAAMALKPRP